MYYMDGSRLEDVKVGCDFLLTTNDGLVGEGQFCLSDERTVFAAKVHAIKEAITYALQRGLGELKIFSDFRLALQVLNFLVPYHRAAAEIRDLVRRNGIITHMQYIKAHFGYA